MKKGKKKWCGEGDLFSLGPLKTRNLYTSQSAQSAKSATSTATSHTFSHTAPFREAVMSITTPSAAHGVRPRTTNDLTESERAVLKVMSDLWFGRLEHLNVTNGQLEMQGNSAIVREIKLGSKQSDPVRPEEFELKEEQAEFFALCRSLKRGEIKKVEIRHGLPCSMQIEEFVGQLLSND